MATTNHLGITLVEQSQAQKEVTVNTALARVDAVLNTGAVDRAINTPPGSPAAGDVYILGASPTGAWSGQAGKLAYYDQTWKFITPREGMSLWVSDEDVSYSYDGAAWVPANAFGRPVIDVTGSKTFALTDGGSFQRCTSPSATTLTVPDNSSVALPIGIEVEVYRAGSGTVTFAVGGAAVIQSRSGLLSINGQYGRVQLKKLATNTWALWGDLV